VKTNTLAGAHLRIWTIGPHNKCLQIVVFMEKLTVPMGGLIMSKQAWFHEYERLEAENPTATDEELCEMADEALIDNMSSAADAASDEARDHG